MKNKFKILISLMLIWVIFFQNNITITKIVANGNINKQEESVGLEQSEV